MRKSFEDVQPDKLDKLYAEPDELDGLYNQLEDSTTQIVSKAEIVSKAKKSQIGSFFGLIFSKDNKSNTGKDNEINTGNEKELHLNKKQLKDYHNDYKAYKKQLSQTGDDKFIIEARISVFIHKFFKSLAHIFASYLKITKQGDEDVKKLSVITAKIFFKELGRVKEVFEFIDYDECLKNIETSSKEIFILPHGADGFDKDRNTAFDYLFGDAKSEILQDIPVGSFTEPEFKSDEDGKPSMQLGTFHPALNRHS